MAAQQNGPEQFTPEWNALREQMLAKIGREQKSREIPWTPSQRRTSELALQLCAISPGMIGYEEAREAYERDAITRIEAALAETPVPPKQTQPLVEMPEPAEMAESDYPF